MDTDERERQAWITVYLGIHRPEGSYDDLIPVLTEMCGVGPSDLATDGRSHEWTFTPKRLDERESEN